MRCEAPDTHFFADIREFNLEFLALVAAGRQLLHGPVLGLDVAVADQVSQLRPRQLEDMASTPCLLVGFGAAARGGARVAEPLPEVDPRWLERARLFATGLLTYVWQATRRDPLRAALCLGAGGPGSVDHAARDLRGRADRALTLLEARFGQSSRFWPDLVKAVRDGHPARLQLARLTAIQLAAAEARGEMLPAAERGPHAITR